MIKSTDSDTGRGGSTGLDHPWLAPFLFAGLLLLVPAAAHADVAYSDSADFALETTGILTVWELHFVASPGATWF